MSISLQDPPEHVLPHAYDRSLVGYWVQLTMATLISAFAMSFVVRGWIAEYEGFHTVSVESLVMGCVFLWIAPAILAPMVMRPAEVLSSNPVFLPVALLRLSRSPVGWALLREGARISGRRSEIKGLERSLPTLQNNMIGFNESENVLVHEANLLNAWNKLLVAETSLADRQRRYLAGESVAFDDALASSP